MATQTDDGFHEIQLNGKQLVFLFMAATVVSVVIFLCGVLVGRGVRTERIAVQSAALSETPQDILPSAPPLQPSAIQADADPRIAPPPAPVDEKDGEDIRPDSVKAAEAKAAEAKAAEAKVAEAKAAEAKSPDVKPGEKSAKAADKSASAKVAADKASASPSPSSAENSAKAKSEKADRVEKAAQKPAEKPAEKVSPVPKPIPEPSAATTTAAKPSAVPPPASATATSTAGDGYAVQVAAVNVRTDADAIAKRFNSKGYSAYVETPPNATSVFRVRIGTFKTKREAETIAAKLQKEEQIKPWVTR